MKKLTDQDPETKSSDIVAENVAHLKALFPDVFTEGKIDFDALRQIVGGSVEDREEKYGLNWHGKRRARQLALTPSTGTLRPCHSESVDWDTTRNLMIEGDNLEVLKLLQKAYAGRIKLIFIDPPYNTGNDFVYKDDYQDNLKNYLMLSGQVESDGRKISSNTESSGRFHTDWLNMMYPRLRLARQLLSADGAMFLTIDSGEAANLTEIMNEIFGEENFVVSAAWHKRVSPANDAKWFSSDHDMVLVYARNKEAWRPALLDRTAAQLENYKNPDGDARGPWNSATYTCSKTKDERPNLYYPIQNPTTGVPVWPKETAVWKYSEDVTKAQVLDNRLYWGVDGKAAFPRVKLFLSEMNGVVPRSVWSSDEFGHTQQATAELKALFGGAQVFDTPKPVRLIRRIVELGGCAPGDIVLDFFAGSGTTGHAVMEYNTDDPGGVRYILVQMPEPLDGGAFSSVADITKERLRRAASKVRDDHPMLSGDLGFRVLKLDSSNIEEWAPDRQDLDNSLKHSIEHLKEVRSDADILHELMLKLGLDLCLPIATRTIASKQVHAIGGGALLVCLAEVSRKDEAEGLALGIVDWHKELSPASAAVCVFRDSGFVDDVVKTNLTAILEQHGLSNVRSL